MNLNEVLKTILLRYFVRKKLPKGHIGKNSHIHTPSIVSRGVENIYLGDYCKIDWGNTLYCYNSKFVMKSHSAAAVGLTVVTGNHHGKVGQWQNDSSNDELVGKDVIVEEDVWMGANVTLIAGAVVGRGSRLGTGTVLAGKQIPPYSIVVGNPAKIVGFRFTPEEIIEHEKILYPESERLSIDVLEKNYEKFFLKRLKEIKEHTKI